MRVLASNLLTIEMSDFFFKNIYIFFCNISYWNLPVRPHSLASSVWNTLSGMKYEEKLKKWDTRAYR